MSTYPPTLCGLATFTSALFADLVTGPDDTGHVVQVTDVASAPGRTEVAAQLVAQDSASCHRAATVLNNCDVVIVQHEYGAYGGRDGDELLALLSLLTVPTMIVLHTVLSSPTRHQREVLTKVAQSADSLITMTTTARDRLSSGWAIDMSKVSVIPHGAPVSQTSQMPIFRTGQPTVLTWGLMGPGKGIEWGIQAMAALSDLDPAPRYLVAGQTHPKVVLHEGEAYRERLLQLVRDLDLTSAVTIDGHYRHSAALAELVGGADVVLLPYDSTDQVTSGVLIEAVAAGKPVVATRFPHAVELLGDGAGIVVPHRDPVAIAGALRTLLTDRRVLSRSTQTAVAKAAELHWPAVAARYRELANRLIKDRVAA